MQAAPLLGTLVLNARALRANCLNFSSQLSFRKKGLCKTCVFCSVLIRLRPCFLEVPKAGDGCQMLVPPRGFDGDEPVVVFYFVCGCGNSNDYHEQFFFFFREGPIFRASAANQDRQETRQPNTCQRRRG